MATPSTRNLVLLLSSGHTVRIALREGDLTTSLDEDPIIGVPEMSALLEMPAVICKPAAGRGDVVMAYIEDPSLPTYAIGKPLAHSDLQRITVEGPISNG